MLREFRDFLMRGNLVELAVAFVMGLAFAALITSFVDGLVMPMSRWSSGSPTSATSVADEERRHQELLAAIRGLAR
ncbi:MAG TPA: MscL family protein [Gaiellaceae bacterium]|nr:MscL family protein [Gaiellaceae bacterium]